MYGFLQIWIAHWDIIVLHIGNSYQIRLCDALFVCLWRPSWISAPLKYEVYTPWLTVCGIKLYVSELNWSCGIELGTKSIPSSCTTCFIVNHEELRSRSVQKMERQSEVSEVAGCRPIYIFVWVGTQLNRIGTSPIVVFWWEWNACPGIHIFDYRLHAFLVQPQVLRFIYFYLSCPHNKFHQFI